MKLPIFCAAAVLAAFAIPVRAEVLVVSANAPTITAPWSTSVSIPRFDPNVGTLTNVRVLLRVNTLGNCAFENRSAATAQATANVTGTVNATLGGPPGGGGATTVSASTTVPVSVSAPQFDGVNDFGGTSGGLIANLQGTNTNTAAPLNLNAYTGTGSLSIALAGLNQSTVSVPANFGMRPGVAVGAVIEITYVYTPHPDCDSDGIRDSLEADSDGDGLPDDCDEEAAEMASPTRPGSILVFPEFDHTPGNVTLLTVTNTAPFGSPPTTIFVGYVSSTCQQSALQLTLQPRDTVSFLSSYLTPSNWRGFVYVRARNGATGPFWDYDHLVGSALCMNGIDAFSFGYPAISFQATTGEGNPTDLDADNIADLDGTEYVQAPDRLAFPGFLGSTANRSNDIVLINLSGGTAFTATLSIAAFNDLGYEFNQSSTFTCWRKTALSSIQSGTSEDFLDGTQNAPAEVLGASSIESGWLEIEGLTYSAPGGPLLPNPAILAMLIQKSTTGSVAILPYFLGEQDNGDIMPTTAAGDP